jgi:hypothetical protein
MCVRRQQGRAATRAQQKQKGRSGAPALEKRVAVATG